MRNQRVSKHYGLAGDGTLVVVLKAGGEVNRLIGGYGLKNRTLSFCSC